MEVSKIRFICLIALNPQIKDHLIKPLMEITGPPEDWDEIAFHQTLKGLKFSNIPEDKIKPARYPYQKRTKLQEIKRAKDPYSILDFIGSPLLTFLDRIFSWELKKVISKEKRIKYNGLRQYLHSLLLLFSLFSAIYKCKKTNQHTLSF